MIITRVMIIIKVSGRSAGTETRTPFTVPQYVLITGGALVHVICLSWLSPGACNLFVMSALAYAKKLGSKQ